MNVFYLSGITSGDVTSPKVRNYTRKPTEVVRLNASHPLELESFIHPACIFFHSWLLTLFQAESTRAYTDFICFYRKSNYLRMLSYLSPLLKIFLIPQKDSITYVLLHKTYVLLWHVLLSSNAQISPPKLCTPSLPVLSPQTLRCPFLCYSKFHSSYLLLCAG